MKEQKNKIDNLLKEWDQQIQLDEKKQDNLKNNILKQLADKPSATNLHENYFMLPKNFVYGLGIAAIFLIIPLMVFFMFYLHTNGINPPQKLLEISKDEILELKKATDEINHLFPEGVCWIKRDNRNDFKMEIGKKHDASQSNKSKIIVRYTILKRKQKGKWQDVYFSDLIISPGQSLSINRNHDYVWAYKVDKNVYALDSFMNLKTNGIEFNMKYTGGQQTNVPVEIKRLEKQGVEYRLYQTIMEI